MERENKMVELKPWGEINCSDKNNSDVCVMGVPFDGAVSCGKRRGAGSGDDARTFPLSTADDRGRSAF